MIRVTDLLCFGARGSDCIIFFFLMILRIIWTCNIELLKRSDVSYLKIKKRKNEKFENIKRVNAAVISLIDITRWQFNRDPFVDKGSRRKQCPLFLFTRRPVHVRATRNILYTHARPMLGKQASFAYAAL